MEETQGSIPRRRTLLQRGVALVAGALGVGAIARETTAAPTAVAATGSTLRLHGRGRPAARVASGPRVAGSRTVYSGDLRREGESEVIGSFHTSGFSAETSLGPRLPAASDIAFQTFILEEGTLFGLGSSVGGERTCAVLGGTGRFAGARGIYVERTPSTGPVDRDTVEFVFTLSA